MSRPFEHECSWGRARARFNKGSEAIRGNGRPPLSTALFDAISRNGVVEPFSMVRIDRGNALEDRRVVWQRYFFYSLFPSVDRFGTGKEEHYSGRLLGVQRAGQRPGPKLLRHLPPRFCWGAHDPGAVTVVHQKFVFEMARSIGGKESQKAFLCTQQVGDRGGVESLKSKTVCR